MNKLFITTLASWLLLFTGSVAEAQTARARIADTPIREAANVASAIIATLKEGDPVDVVDLQGDWYRVLVPNEQGKPRRVGYVLARLIEIVNRDGSPVRGERPIAQGPPIPPTLAQAKQAQLERENREKATKREQALRAEVDALQAELKAVQQVPPAAPSAPRRDEQRAARNQPAAWADHVRISINAGAQPSWITFAGSTTKAVYLENAVVNTTYDGVGRGQSFDGGVLVRVVGNFGVGVAVSSFVKRQDGALAATIPHPFFYNTPRAIAGTAGGLERNELVTHIQAAYVISSGGKVDFALSGGPSFFSVKQGLVSDVTYTESYPYDTATFAAASSTTISTTKIGFNAGADVGVRLSKNVGVGGLVRFSRTSIEFPLSGATTNVKSDAGGVQVAGGLRLFF